MKAGTLEIELITNVARLQKEMADMKRSVAGAMGDIEPSRVYRRVKLSKDNPHDREAFYPQIHAQVFC